MNFRTTIRALCPYENYKTPKHVHPRLRFKKADELKFNNRGDLLINRTEENHLLSNIPSIDTYYQLDREVFTQFDLLNKEETLSVELCLQIFKRNGVDIEFMMIQPESKCIVFAVNVDHYVFWLGYYFYIINKFNEADLTNYYISEKDFANSCYSKILQSPLTYKGFTFDVCECIRNIE